ncbi:hypothetical protein JCM19233_4767 [Vibrio astriarenae]|nr:hypothetical protein JCM19233_4767 [Vibrio sp. C7]
MYQVTQGVLNDLHPENFKQHSALGMKAHHSWKAYQAFYSEHFDQTERQIVSMLKDKIALECDKMRSNQ